MNTTVGIIGLGFVGDAIENSLKTKNIPLNVYDKYKNGGIGTFENVLNSNMIFLCLPTLYDEQKSSYNKDALDQICNLLNQSNYHGPVIIKSTVEPTTTEEFANKYNLAFIHNPEFLTARTARTDFHNQSHIVLGKSKNCSDEQLNMINDFYQQHWPNATISLTTSTSSECMKIFCNSFYAMKISMFNEYYLMCQKLNIEYDGVVNIMLKNNWINPMHTNVPGPDGKMGYGGACFPKDTKALLAQMKNLDLPHKMLEASISENSIIRNE
jgi:nucleotide sugar dehydrogenase